MAGSLKGLLGTRMSSPAWCRGGVEVEASSSSEAVAAEPSRPVPGVRLARLATSGMSSSSWTKVDCRGVMARPSCGPASCQPALNWPWRRGREVGKAGMGRREKLTGMPGVRGGPVGVRSASLSLGTSPFVACAHQSGRLGHGR